jgi:hypothetical protein
MRGRKGNAVQPGFHDITAAGAFFSDQQVLLPKILFHDMTLRKEAVGYRENQGILIQRDHFKECVFLPVGNDQIAVMASQFFFRFFRVADTDRKIELWQFASDLLIQLGQNGLCDSFGCADPAGTGRGSFPEKGYRFLILGQNGIGILFQSHSRFAEPQSLTDPLKKSCMIKFLQFTDGFGYSRLAHMQYFGRSGH